jgi:hypothetical protein
MKKIFLIGAIFIASATINNCKSQTLTNDFYNIKPVTGNGIRFWNNDLYKIHMGNTAPYKYGSVTDYSIKFNMNNTLGRGWTWGIADSTPIAALSNIGDFKIKNQFKAKECVIEHIASADWGYALSVWVNRDYTKALTVNTTSGASLFTVWGNGVVNTKKIYAEEIVVQANTVGAYWPDYVFKPNFKLLPIKELEKFISKNSHLPEVPSTLDVKKDGVNLVEMDAVLLKKIEELTLYIIAQEKRIVDLEKLKIK